MSQRQSSAPRGPQIQSEPHPPFPPQHQDSPGLEARLDPQPRWRGERYRAADKLAGKRALITGGDSGIGRSVAYHFAREGADVAITYLPEEIEDAQATREAVESEGRKCLLLEGDLVEEAFCRRAVEETVEGLGGIDILVSNAAWQNRKAKVEDVSEEELDRTMKTNVYAYLRLVRAAAPHLAPGSAIISTGSEVGLEGSSRLPDYGATKGAIHSLTKCLAQNLMDRGIRVNCVAPGPVWTPLNPADAGATADEVAQFGQKMGSSPMNRPAQPEEVAPSFVFLASDADASYITGAILPVTGKPE